MPIEALPQATINTIGSTQCLTDASSVVKELVDNAIDANATAIAIEISTNTIDKIQVKDNGSGVAPDDRSLVCKRYCTSKIRTLDDLKGIGGTSFGFRGEALASAVDLSDQVIVTTRIDGEATAVELTFNPQGHQISEKHVSQPVGTTVCISDYLKNIPVRRQTALKDRTTAYQLTKLKRTLQAYCIARPYLRISFKVLKAKTEKHNWVYAPKHPRSTPRSIAFPETAIKVFGSKAAVQCQIQTWVVSKSDDTSVAGRVGDADDEPDDNIDFVFQAYLPKKNFKADLTNLSPPRQFISIDGRPVSSFRGTAKQIVSRFKKAYKACRSVEGVKPFSDPLICLNVACVLGSYDANIEPAKDDVLFEQPEKVIEAADAFFRHVYGVPDNAGANGSAAKKVGMNNFDLLLSDRHSDMPHTPSRPVEMDSRLVDIIAANNGAHQRQTSVHRPTSPDGASGTEVMKRHGKGRQSMYDDAWDDLPVLPIPEADSLSSHHLGESEQEGPAERDATVSNPWAFAKLNAAMRQPAGRMMDKIHAMSRSAARTQLPSPTTQPGETLSSLSAIELPTRSARPGKQHATEERDQSPPFFPFPDQRRGQTAAASSSTQAPRYEQDIDSTQSALDNWLNSRADANHTSSGSHQTGTPLNQIPSSTQKPRSSRPRNHKSSPDAPKKPFVPPSQSQDLRDVAFFPPSSRLSHQPSTRKARPQHSNDFSELNMREDTDLTSNDAPHPDLAETMEYEARKQRALQKYKQQEKERARLLGQTLPSRRSIQDRGAQIETGMPSPPPSSPHRNRYIAAKAALQPRDPTSPDHEHIQGSPALTPSDPRALLIAHGTHPLSPRTRKRSRSRVRGLPFESTSPSDQIHELQLVLPVSVQQISRQLEESYLVDAFVTSGCDFDGFGGVHEGMVESWTGRLEDLVRRSLPQTVGRAGGLDPDLRFLLSGGQESVVAG